MISHARLLEILDYDPEKGVFRWRVFRNQFCLEGGLLLSKNAGGYPWTEIGGRHYTLHRLAWFYMTGEWPQEVDHRDCDKENYKWKNLRLASRSENCVNVRTRIDNTSGVKGVSFHKLNRKWQARLGVNCKRVHLGYFDSLEDAKVAYRNAALAEYGDFARSE